ncbi:hypothetical protein, partial [Pseudomonas aeruginosa]|uniref:hypothetical protein n=1 Tax=Pseudomonas aeruginosa TaxID=287 RepID=UPI0031B7207B
AFKALIINLARNQVMQIRNADTQQLDEQMTLLESKRLELSLELDVSFKYAIADYRHKLLHETETGIEQAQHSYSETITVQKSGFGNWLARKIWGGGSEERTVVRTKVISSQVVGNINAFMNEVQDELDIKVENSHRWLDQELGKILTPKIREVLQKDTNAQMIRQAITSTINALPEPDFALNIPLPDNLKSRGTLKGYEAFQRTPAF